MDNDMKTVSMRFDPRRDQVATIVQAILNDQPPEGDPQCVADAILAACIIGEIFEVSSEDDYLTMIRAALPNARKAAARLCADTP